ncbi:MULTISPECIES: hypothetical protein [unclassified Microcoleus]|uniref:hypothetical protein n=1 Tax=unclassified Microcoleus TaxID=2642155 RepID=UPI002FD12F7E
MGIYSWVGAGLLDCRLLTIIVGETRPYDRRLKPQLHLPCFGATRDFKKGDLKPDVM